MIRNFRELYQYRALLWSLTLRELKARYRGSVLGFLWTFLNPTLLMLMYALVFGLFMQQAIPHYTYFMFVGLLPWIWFSTSIGAGASTISERRDLLTKVRFPAQVLPTTVVVTNFINYLLALPLMLGLGAINGIYPSVQALAFPLVLLVQFCFTLGLLFIVSALNVAFRDLQHIVNNILTLAFFATPIIYPASTIQNGHTSQWLKDLLLYGNPMSVITASYQAIFYDHTWPNLHQLLSVLGVSVVLLWVSSYIFERRREEFAELI
jgi:lipopolysaccharide transport system permease protein